MVRSHRPRAARLHGGDSRGPWFGDDHREGRLASGVKAGDQGPGTHGAVKGPLLSAGIWGQRPLSTPTAGRPPQRALLPRLPSAVATARLAPQPLSRHDPVARPGFPATLRTRPTRQLLPRRSWPTSCSQAVHTPCAGRGQGPDVWGTFLEGHHSLLISTHALTFSPHDGNFRKN